MGRRTRDKILAGDVRPLPSSVPPEQRSAAQNRMLFLADELRESALAAAGIEAFLVRVHRLLERPDFGPDQIAELLASCDLDERIGALDDALCSLRRSLQSVIGASTLAVNNA